MLSNLPPNKRPPAPPKSTDGPSSSAPSQAQDKALDRILATAARKSKPTLPASGLGAGFSAPTLNAEATRNTRDPTDGDRAVPPIPLSLAEGPVTLDSIPVHFFENHFAPSHWQSLRLVGRNFRNLPPESMRAQAWLNAITSGNNPAEAEIAAQKMAQFTSVLFAPALMRAALGDRSRSTLGSMFGTRGETSYRTTPSQTAAAQLATIYRQLIAAEASEMPAHPLIVSKLLGWPMRRTVDLETPRLQQQAAKELGAVPLDRRLPSPKQRKVALARNRRQAPSITPVFTG
jgi:hypothetical protein